MKDTNEQLLLECAEQEELNNEYQKKLDEALGQIRQKIVEVFDDMGFELSSIKIDGPLFTAHDRIGNPPYRQQFKITVSSLQYTDKYDAPEGWPI